MVSSSHQHHIFSTQHPPHSKVVLQTKTSEKDTTKQHAFLSHVLSFISLLSHCLVVAVEVLFDSMKSTLMTAQHICTVFTLEEEKTSFLSKFVPLCREKANTLGRHKRASHPHVRFSGSLAGKMYFQILATDNYVSNKNKPFLPGMLSKTISLSLSFPDLDLCSSESCALHVLFEIMCQMAVKQSPPFF